jgi:hypothetical protein
MKGYSFFLAFFLAANTVLAQPEIGCNDKIILLEAQEMKRNLQAQGMVIFKDAMLKMESKEPFPIAVQLTKGQLYQMVYIGSKDASKIRFELFDGNNKRIAEETQKDVMQRDFIIYSFTPEKSDIYLVGLTQHCKKKPLCGSFTILQKKEPAKK